MKDREEMYLLLKPYYINPKYLLRRELKYNSHAYIASHENNIVAFLWCHGMKE